MKKVLVPNAYICDGLCYDISTYVLETEALHKLFKLLDRGFNTYTTLKKDNPALYDKLSAGHPIELRNVLYARRNYEGEGFAILEVV